VIQPHLPVRLPCYDFTPIADPTFDGSLPRVGPPASGVAHFRGVTGGDCDALEPSSRSHRTSTSRASGEPGVDRHRFRPSPTRPAGYYASADFLQWDSGSLTIAGSPGVTTKTVSDIPNGYFSFNQTTSPWYTHGSPYPLSWGCRLFQTLRTSVTGCVLSFPTLRALARRSGFSPLRLRSCPAPLIVYKARERIHRGVADPRLLATPTSWGRVADPNPNHARFFGIRSPSRDRSPLWRAM
jgi:hypothetical protein